MRHALDRSTPPVRQEGVALFIALISLVILTIGAFALYRSVDTLTAVGGNIGLREQGVSLASNAAETAIAWLKSNGSGNATTLNSSQSGDGYYASADENLDLITAKNDAAKALLLFDWDGKAKKLASSPDNKFTLYYVIHRLCTNAGSPIGQSCQTCGSTLGGASSATGETSGFGASSGTANPCYRITARAIGPRNVESIVQIIAK